MRDLTPKQARFVDEYLIDLNATQAAIRAGFSARTATWIGPQVLAKTHVQAAIQAAKTARAIKTGLTAEKVLADIETIKRSCMREITDPISGQSIMVDPKAALKAAELEGKHLGIWQDKLDIKNSDGSLRPTTIKIVAA